MEKNIPKVSIIMPTFNGEKFIKQAIDSILKQTFTNFEFLILDGGSTDNTIQIIKNYKDHRISLIEAEGQHLTLVDSLNLGIDLSRGEYIARMDCDDISKPDRLKKQVRFMDLNKNIGICGSWTIIFGKKIKSLSKCPIKPESIKINLLFSNPIVHPSIIMRKSLLKQHNLYYDKNYKAAEDYEFWFRCSKYFDLANIPEPLLNYRVSNESASHRRAEEQKILVSNLIKEILNYYEIDYNQDEFKIHLLASSNYECNEFNELVYFDDWLNKLETILVSKCGFNKPEVFIAFASVWFNLCRGLGTKFGLKTWKLFYKSRYSKYLKFSFADSLIFLSKCILHYGI